MCFCQEAGKNKENCVETKRSWEKAAVAGIGDRHPSLMLHITTREKGGPGVSQLVVTPRKQAEAGFNGMFQKDELAKCHKNEP